MATDKNTPAEKEPDVAPEVAPEVAIEPAPPVEPLPYSADAEMITVETTGDFMLIDPITRVQIEAEGTTTLPKSGFIQDRIDLGHLKEVK